jgi:hypothetical protein
MGLENPMTREISAFFAVCLFATAAMAAPCIAAKDNCTEWIGMGSGPDRVMVYRTVPLDSRNEAISRALIVVHGAPRNADNYFRGATAAAFLAAALDDTVIISPHFASNSSAGCHDKLAANEINWSCEGWRMGGDANGNSTLSSYDVIPIRSTRSCHLRSATSSRTHQATLTSIRHAHGKPIMQLAPGHLDSYRILRRIAPAQPRGRRIRSSMTPRIARGSTTGRTA